MLSYFGGMALTTLALTCGDIQKSYTQDQITEQKYSCSLSKEACDKLQLTRLQKTARHFSEDVVEGKSIEELEQEYDPKYRTYKIGNQIVESVDISLGDNPFEMFFWQNTADAADLYSHDGSLVVGKDYCDAELTPFISPLRTTRLCTAVVSEVKKAAPKATFTQEACEKQVDIYVEDHSENVLELYMSRNLGDVGAGYFTCNATMDRKKDVLTSFACNVVP